MKHRHHFDRCIACSACVAHCPVAAVDRGFSGPKLTGPVAERFRHLPGAAEGFPEYCSNCKNCDITCPSEVPVSTLNMLARAEYYKTHRHSLRDWVLSHGEALAKAAGPAGGLANLGLANPLSRLVLKKIGVAGQMPLPRYAAKTFLQRFQALPQQPFADKVVFYPGCFINYNDPQTGLDLVAVLQANRHEVLAAGKVECCGSPLVVNGYLEEAGQKAARNIRALKARVDEGLPLVTCCPSCALMLKQEVQELFAVEGAVAVAARLYDAAEFLLELYDQGRLNTDFTRQAGRYLYHAPCHLRAQGIGLPGLELLRMLPGLEVIEADAGCCGIAGNYGFKSDRYDIAMAVGAALFKKVKDSKAEAVVSECGTCRWQIAQAAGVKTLHPLALIRRAYGGH
ncbi:MAG: anaerobic glycerol-3-phosphate dehydrogenase subunit C [Negativicutes bacterium]|nr:anaerobic glycerol-3-phosphate dehydrogenase subunit C [Negativicutes bacterium]